MQQILGPCPTRHQAPLHPSSRRARRQCHGPHGRGALGLIRATTATGTTQGGHPWKVSAQVIVGGSRGTRTHNLRIKSRQLACWTELTGGGTCRFVHVGGVSRATQWWRVTTGTGVDERTTSEHGGAITIVMGGVSRNRHGQATRY